MFGDAKAKIALHFPRASAKKMSSASRDTSRIGGNCTFRMPYRLFWQGSLSLHAMPKATYRGP